MKNDPCECTKLQSGMFTWADDGDDDKRVIKILSGSLT